jgi:hypothetical protein
MPEPFFLATVLLLVVYLIADINNKIPNIKFIKNKPLMYGLICGLNLSLKFTFVPALILPFFILGGSKDKLRYGIYVFVAFYLFTFPLFVRTPDFYRWIKGIFIHSGTHGSGDANIVDFKSFIINLRTIFQQTKYFFVPQFIALGLILLSLFKNVKDKISNMKYLILLIGTFITSALFLILVSKHYAHYYLVPGLMLTLFIYYLIVQNIKMIFFPKSRIIENFMYLIILGLFLFAPHSYRQYRDYSKIRLQKYNAKLVTIDYLNNNNLSSPFIIASDGWSVKKEHGLWFGKIMTPQNNKYFTSVLNKYYPDTYFYKEQWGSFMNWDNDEIKLEELLKMHDKINIVINKWSEDVSEELIQLFKSQEGFKLNLLHNNQSAGIHIFELYIIK